MPTYIYANQNTGERFALEQSIEDLPYTHHPANGEPVKRIIQLPGLKLKGKGWYSTDHAKGKGRTE